MSKLFDKLEKQPASSSTTTVSERTTMKTTEERTTASSSTSVETSSAAKLQNSRFFKTMKTIGSIHVLKVLMDIGAFYPQQVVYESPSYLTTKQYYTAISRLKKAGLIQKIYGFERRYIATSYGFMIFKMLQEIEKVSGNYEYISALDQIQNPTEDIINTLIKDVKIQRILISSLRRRQQEQQKLEQEEYHHNQQHSYNEINLQLNE